MLTYPNNAGSPAVNLLETKIFLNSTISDAMKGSYSMALDTHNFLATPMARPEFMKVYFKHIPGNIRQQ